MLAKWLAKRPADWFLSLQRDRRVATRRFSMCLAQAEFVYLSASSPVVSLEGPFEKGSDGLTPLHKLTDQSADPFADRVTSEQLQLVAAFMAILSAREHAIVNAYFWGGETQRQIATWFGISQPAVAKIINRVIELGRRQFASFH